MKTISETTKLLVLEVLEPRILLSADGLLNAIIPDQGQDTLPDSRQEVVQYAELLDTHEEAEEQILVIEQLNGQELEPSDILETNLYEPIVTLFSNQDPTDIDEPVDVLSNSGEDTESKSTLTEVVDTSVDAEVTSFSAVPTKDSSMPIYVNDAEIGIEENTSIEIRGPPSIETGLDNTIISCLESERQEVDHNILDEYAAEVQPDGTLDLPSMHLVDPTVDYFDGQIVYLDFDGEENVTYNGPVTVEGIDVPAFVAPGDLAGQEQAIITEVMGSLEHLFAGSGIIFTTERPCGNQLYSTIYVGGDDSAFANYGSFLGLAEQVDVGNTDRSDNAFVFSDNIVSGHTDPGSLVTHLTNLLCHETGHLLGYGHDNEDPNGGVLSIVAAMADRFEPNDSFEAATDLGTLGNRTEADLTIHEPYNSDYYLLTAAGSGTLNVDILFSHSLGNLNLAVYNSSQSWLASSISATDNESVSVAVTGGQTYYVHVYGYMGATNPDHDLVIDGPEAPADRFELNDSFVEAANLGTLGDRTEADLTIHESDNDDYYLLTAGDSGTLNVDILFSHSLGNLDLEVYDSSHSLLAWSSSAADNESVSVAVTGGQTYYVRVNGYEGATHPDYDLVIDGPEIVGPEIDVELDGTDNVHAHEFGAVDVGQSTSQEFTVRNEGFVVLVVTEAWGLANPFSISPVNGSGSTDNWDIPAGGTQTFTVGFSPDNVGAYSDTLVLTNNDSDEGSYQIVVQGRSGIFGPQQVISTQAIGAFSVYACDLDGDGDDDVLSASWKDDKIAWYENLGGTFGSQQVISTQADEARSVYACDLDGDGDNDVLSASHWDDKIAWYENRLNEPTADFGSQQVISTDAVAAWSVYACDLDGDGDNDVLSASEWDNKTAWYENDGSGTFGAQQAISTEARYALSVYACDLDGDGDNDVLSTSRVDDTIAWYENLGGGTFGSQQVISIQGNATSVYACDLDGDGDNDVLSASSSNGMIAYYENLGSGTFGPQQVISMLLADAPRSVYACDLDGDGDNDVLSASYWADKIAWYENLGGGTFSGQQVISTQADGAQSVYACDLDGDGDNDVLSASDRDNKIAWYENLRPAPGSPEIDVELNDTDNVHTHAFVIVQVSQSISQEFTVRNEGNADLVVIQAGGLDSPFSIIPVNGGGSTDDWVITAGGTQTFTVSFSPDHPGDYSDTLVLTSNDSDEGSYEIGFNGLANEPPSLSIGDVSLAEGHSGTTSFVFIVSLSQASSQTVTVDYTTADGTATVADSDYQATSETLTFNPDEVSQPVEVLVNGDTDVEPDETFFVNLSNATNATIAHGQGVGTIENDDGEFQIVYGTDGSGPTGGSVSIPVFYTTSDNNDMLTGIGVRIHYDSSELELDSFSDVYNNGLLAQGTPEADIDDFDQDPTTDTFVNIAWIKIAGQWPNESLPISLYTANFVISDSLSEGATSTIRFSAGSTAAGYDFESTGITVTVHNYNWDIDDNGAYDALTDGLLTIRYLFGFRGSTLIDGAVAPDANRSTAPEIESYLAAASTEGMLDIDGNGADDALTDGLLIMRYLFGFRGDTLVDGAVASDATRTTAEEIEGFIDSYMPILTSVAMIVTESEAMSSLLQAAILTDNLQEDGDTISDAVIIDDNNIPIYANDDTADQVLELFSTSPALFVENQGQWSDPSVRYVHDGSFADVAITDSGIMFQVTRSESDQDEHQSDSITELYSNLPSEQTDIRSLQFSVSFVGAAQFQPIGLERSESLFNYFIGDQANWRENVPSYQIVAYQGIYEGIDLQIQGLRSHLKYEFHVAPGADWSQIAIRYEGIEGLSIAEDGSLVVDLGPDWGVIRDDVPYIYQEIDGLKVPVSGRFVVLDNQTYTFEITGDINPDRALVIDPDLAWSTYLGGTGNDYGSGIAVDASGGVYVTGGTNSSGWVSGGFDTTLDGGDGFVAKLTSAGGHVWSTYIGGDGGDFGNGIAVDASGEVYVTGLTCSSGWVSGGFDTSFDGGYNDGFVAKLTSAGGHVWSTYLGGTDPDYGHAIYVDASGGVYVTGTTESSGWVSGGFDTSFNGGRYDGFVAKLTSAGAHLWSTYLGGTSDDYGCSIEVDASGGVYVTGDTESSGWVSGGFDTSHNGDYDAFVSKLTGSGGHLWSTYLGGTDYDREGGVALDAAGGVYVTGFTSSSGWVSGGFDTSYNGGRDVFVAKLTSAGGHIWSTYLGGTSTDYGIAIDVDLSGGVYVSGLTSSHGWVSGGFDTSYNGGTDGFVAELTRAGGHVWSTYLGGAGNDYVNGQTIGANASTVVYVTGYTMSSGWVSGGFDTSYNGGYYDGFVAKITYDSTVAPEIDVELDGTDYIHVHSFGTVVIGESASQEFTIRNEGDADLVVTEAAGLISPFSISPVNDSGTADDWVIPALGTQIFTVSFSADNLGEYSDTLVLINNDPDEGSHEIAFTAYVAPVNTAPVLAPIGNKAVDEGSLLTFTAFATDNDIPANALTFSLDPGAPVGASIDPVTGVFNWTPSEEQGPADYAVTVRVTDDGTPNLDDEETITITVNEVNAAPVLDDIEGSPLSYMQNDDPTAVTDTLTVSDTDDTHMESAAIQITGNYQNGQDVLAFTATANIGSSWDAATGTLTLTGTDTLTNYEAALHSVTYHNTSDRPNTLTRTISFTVNDGDANSNVKGRDITVTSDVPVVTTSGGTVSYTEGSGPMVVDNGLTVSDLDDTDLEGAMISVSSGYVNGEDTLGFTDQLGITGSWDPATGVLALSGTSSVANYQTALRSITYTNSSEDPDTTARTISFVVNDGESDSIPATRVITIFALGSISGYKFEDVNGNGTPDRREPRLSGWSINLYLDDGDATFEPGGDDLLVDTQLTTSPDGGYLFTDLEGGDYWVREAFRAGWTQMTVDPSLITIQSGDHITEADDPGLAFGNNSQQPVYFADPNLEIAVEEELLVLDPTTTEMLGLQVLSVIDPAGITDLTGLEHGINLTTLVLIGNPFSDISPLAGLTNLKNLDLRGNEISDISPLSGLTSLDWLGLWHNQISDLSPLSGLTNLTRLLLSDNQLSDISPLSGLTNLTSIRLDNNQISDLSPLSGLTTNLTGLGLDRNEISDLSPLSGLTTNLTWLSLAFNRISDISPLSGLTNLEKLYLNSQSWGSPADQISDLSPLSGLTTNLTRLEVGRNQVSDLSPLSGLTNLTYLDVSCNPLSDISPLSGLTNLTLISLRESLISDLSPLSGLTNLTNLYLFVNQVSDISPLSGLTNLEKLETYTNQISDLSPLSELTNLTYLDVKANPLNGDAYSIYIPQILANNPGMTLLYDPPGVIEGSKWHDLDGDGIWDSGELGLDGWIITLYLDDGDATFEPGGDDVLIDTQLTTSPDGAYSFTVGVGDYWVREVQQAGWSQTTVDPSLITIESGDHITEADYPGLAFGNNNYVSWDIDDNGVYDALTDGLLTIRYLFGFRGSTLIDGAVAPDANRSTAPEIESYLAAASTEGMLDIDGNGIDDALTDGLLIMRYLFGFRGDTLIDGAVAPGAPRDTAEEIEGFIESYMPVPTKNYIRG